MNAIANLDLALQQVLKCLGVCLLGTAAAYAADSGTATAALRTGTWQQTVQYVMDRLPACREYPQSIGVASVSRDRISLYYADHNYGTTDSFPLRVHYTAEAHSADGSWRLFVRFRNDVVTTDVPSLDGHGRSDVFFCDGDMDTTEGLATALTRLHDLLTGAVPAGPQSSDLPEITVQGGREVIIARGRQVKSSRHQMGDLVTLTGRVDVSDLDLSTPGGADEARALIDDVAHRLCHRLDVLYPYSTNERCVRDAVAAATKRVDELIAAARRQ